ncbi:PREDICTED: G-type lectin S-receptor-like serine/threonine-protein kinase LECRK2 [Nelumbo nucifera]|uniref:Receptor-like serine/threonine-protein kinase n=2 Tax=Nelumbo nucifera TaxID=4432 RepID=A0A822Z0T6_NELNU|nr:PREDICTED: G-type lectin S-receptor-like serine/threonine-protein kinase LECRK2 [Nelumbo nucifera]DAD40004.1 TPA_asm: hypothetical protein HUJ06_014327 [Nelumbo nucifera]
MAWLPVILVPFLLLPLLVTIIVVVEAQPKETKLIYLGSSLSPNTQSTPWLSHSGHFALGFHPQRNGFVVAVWLVGRPENTVVWTANRDDPPVSPNASLQLTTNAGLLLLTGQGEERRISNVSDSVSFAAMLDSGNFVLFSANFTVLWESFRFPTNTLLGGQYFPMGSQLLSSVSDTDYSTGRFRLGMQKDGNLVLGPKDDDNPYWASGTNGVQGSNVQLYLNSTGYLSIGNNSGYEAWRVGNGSSSVTNGTAIFRAKLDNDGIFRLYSHSLDGNNVFTSVSTVWEALSKDKKCQVKGLCGFNSYCKMVGMEPVCKCLPGFDFIYPTQMFEGCQRNFTQGCCRGRERKITAFYEIITMDNLLWGEDNPYFYASLTKEDCSKSCLEDCYCGAALFKDGNCQKQEVPLRFVRREQLNESTTAFIKVRTTPIANLETGNNGATVLIVVAILIFLTCSFVSLAIAAFFIYRQRALGYRLMAEMGKLWPNEELTLRLFSYDELQKATDGFKEELGRGSFGAVYKGSIHKGKKIIAVKRLEKMMEEGEREFRAEMRAIGRTHHRNLVRLLGYCAEDSNRLLVYEYMSNGSLADLLFQAKQHPYWNEKVGIALDIAKGIHYLHEECEAPIIHCDIKPQNILMDDFWTAKISDFGLAKLLMPDQTRTFTQVRGTRGYLAPEWQRNTPITVKTDVYSFGIMLLEIVCCRKCMEFGASSPEQIILSNWVYNCFVERQLDKLVPDEEVDMKMLERMVKVGLWCIQDEPVLRPSMKNVILMLESIIEDISVPPAPSPSFVLPDTPT